MQNFVRNLVCAFALILFSQPVFADGCAIDIILSHSGESIVVTSGYRNRSRNKNVGGVINSNHLNPCGARDVLKKPIKDKKAFLAFIHNAGLRVIEYKTHYHIDWGIHK